jgi:hypothetical protein
VVALAKPLEALSPVSGVVPLFSYDRGFDNFPFITREEPQPVKQAALSQYYLAFVPTMSAFQKFAASDAKCVWEVGRNT